MQRLTQLNKELENGSRQQAKPTQENGEESPARDADETSDAPEEKPSIRRQLRSFVSPARAAACMEMAYAREEAR